MNDSSGIDLFISNLLLNFRTHCAVYIIMSVVWYKKCENNMDLRTSCIKPRIYSMHFCILFKQLLIASVYSVFSLYLLWWHTKLRRSKELRTVRSIFVFFYYKDRFIVLEGKCCLGNLIKYFFIHFVIFIEFMLFTRNFV